MNEARLYEIWKQFGKVIRLSEIGVAYASGVRAHGTAMHVQFSQEAGGAEDFAVIQTFLVPTQQKINPVVGSLDRVASISKTSLESYLRTLAPELLLSANSSTPVILDALADTMTALAFTIQPSGKLWAYWRDQFGFDGFPMAEPPDVDDTIITTTIL